MRGGTVAVLTIYLRVTFADEGMPQDALMPPHFDAESDLKCIDKAEGEKTNDLSQQK